VQVVCHSQTVEDHGEGHEDDACDEDVEGVFWFGNAVVSSRQAESEDFADVADVEATDRNEGQLKFERGLRSLSLFPVFLVGNGRSLSGAKRGSLHGRRRYCRTTLLPNGEHRLTR
jgi:hypothetical protein